MEGGPGAAPKQTSEVTPRGDDIVVAVTIPTAASSQRPSTAVPMEKPRNRRTSTATTRGHSVFGDVHQFIASQTAAYSGIVKVLCDRIDSGESREQALEQRVERLEKQLNNLAFVADAVRPVPSACDLCVRL